VYWLTVLALWVGIIGGGAAAYVLFTVPDDALDLPQRERGLIVLAEDGRVLARRGTFRGDTVRTDELPSYLIDAVIATEDRRFYSHFGADPIGLLRALVANIREGEIVQGGSTITQQLAKNLFLEPDRTFTRKFQELVLAIWLEYRYSKDEILQLYLNRVYFGAGAWGIEAAARRYFGKSAREVTLPEAAVLAGLLKAPSRFAPTNNPELAEERAFLVLNGMVEAGYISPLEGQLAVDNPAALNLKPQDQAEQYVVDWITEILPGYVRVDDRTLIVHTTIDADLQKATGRVVRDVLDRKGEERDADQAAMVVLSPDGAVRALVGGRSYAQSQFNRAVKARRQPGSAFKPFVFLAALERGYSPDSIVVDRPVTVGKWRPANYNDKYYGEVTLQDALALSLNSVAAQLVLKVGPKAVASVAHRLGISSPLHHNASLALGTAEVGLIELTAAYAPFSNGGAGVLPHVIDRVTDDSGTVLYERRGSGPGQVVSADNVAAMNRMLAAVVTGGTGRAAALDGYPAAGKSGTSQDFRDAWFVGYTADYVAGVWVGNDSNRPMEKVTGGSLPAEIWHDVMTVAHADRAPKPLPGTDRTRPAEPFGIVDLLRSLPFGPSEARVRQPTETAENAGNFIERIRQSVR